MGRSLVLAAILGGCFRPTPPEGAPCDSNGECPSSLVCDQGVCVSHPRDSGIEIDAMIDANLACSCAGNTLQCPEGDTACPAGCTTSNGPRCAQVVPSNNLSPTFGPDDITIDGLATFNTSTGAITGAITRAAGSGVVAGIGYQRQTNLGASIGVFSFHKLVVTGTGIVHFTGGRAAAFLVETDATIAGQIDGSGGCYGGARACAGPGGGVGAIFTATPGGCGPGSPGLHDEATGADSGGGGGGAGAIGGKGGTETASGTMFAGGNGGAACLTPALEPLVGGSGGGGGGPGASATPTTGGGGGGALQLTAFDTIIVSGVITMGGAGGEPGPTDANNGGAPGGGGAGGAVLLEAPVVTIAGTIAANGGGGGGASDHLTVGSAGENGKASASPAMGGAAAPGGGAGGAGGAGTTPAADGKDSTNINSGAGGGAVGRILIRSLAAPATSGTTSPPPALDTLRTM